jgi:hypothetical protein
VDSRLPHTDAGDGRAAAVVDFAAGRGEGRDGDRAGVDQPHADGGALRPGGDEPPLDGELPDAGEEVAAGLAVGNGRFFDTDLKEEVIDVVARLGGFRLGGFRLGGFREDGDLAGDRLRAAEAVDLARIGGAHDPQQQVVAGGRVGGQVFGEEVRALRGSAAHEHAAHAGHACSFSYSSAVRYRTPRASSFSRSP